jgi:outer membrane protein assembly factor BamB
VDRNAPQSSDQPPDDRLKMRTLRRSCAAWTLSRWIAVVACAASAGSGSAAQVLASRNDDARTGANLSEIQLTVANVNRQQFGRLFSYSVEGNIYAQPLIATDVKTNSGPRNIVYVATSDNVVYAFDADRNTNSGGLIWSRRFGDPPTAAVATSGGFVPFNGLLIPVPPNTAPLIGPVPWNDPTHYILATTTFIGNIGIIGTPVIDRGRNAIYLVVRTKTGATYAQTLHALDLSTGNERVHSPIVIASGSSQSSFAAFQNQRPGLALTRNRVIVAWGSPGGAEDTNRFNGYVLAFDADSLARTGCYTTGVMRGGGAGFWQAGRAPVVDNQGFLYFFSGNGKPRDQDPENLCTAGSFPTNPPRGEQQSNSLLQLDFRPPQPLQPLIDQVVVPEQHLLDVCDIDLGGSGPLLVPGTTNLIGGGKQGLLHMFKIGPGGRRALTQTVQVYDGPRETFHEPPAGHEGEACDGPGDVSGQGAHHIMGGPIYWKSATRGAMIYVSPESEFIRAYRYEERLGQLDPTPLMRSPWQVLHHPGAILSLSANGNRSGSGILWAAHADRTPASHQSPFYDNIKGIVRALDAEDLSHELWNSDMDGAEEFNFAKFTPVTIANGKVYVPTFSGRLIVFGKIN